MSNDPMILCSAYRRRVIRWFPSLSLFLSLCKSFTFCLSSSPLSVIALIDSLSSSTRCFVCFFSVTHLNCSWALLFVSHTHELLSLSHTHFLYLCLTALLEAFEVLWLCSPPPLDRVLCKQFRPTQRVVVVVLVACNLSVRHRKRQKSVRERGR